MNLGRDNFDYFEDRPQNIEIEHARRVRYQINLRRLLRDALNPFEVSAIEFRRNYRMHQHAVFDLIKLVSPFVRVRQSPTHIPLELKVLCTLGLFASGSYQRLMGKASELSLCQSSVSNGVEEITEALNHPNIMSRLIHFPCNHAEREMLMERNLQLGLPRVLGFIDGTYVKIVPPPIADRREVYYGRKGYTAINVQIVCDADLCIMSVDTRFPGSCNDPYIYRNSGVRAAMETAYVESRCCLLGDSIYPHEPWLHLPLPHAERGTPEYVYTKRHCQARNAVERCIGVLKARKRCLLCHRTLHYRPVKAGKIINACVVLHNFCKVLNVEDPRPVDVRQDEGEDVLHDVDEEPIFGVRLRRLAV